MSRVIRYLPRAVMAVDDQGGNSTRGARDGGCGGDGVAARQKKWYFVSGWLCASFKREKYCSLSA